MKVSTTLFLISGALAAYACIAAATATYGDTPDEVRCSAALRDEARMRDAWIVAGHTMRTEVAFVSALALAQDVCADAR